MKAKPQPPSRKHRRKPKPTRAVVIATGDIVAFYDALRRRLAADMLRFIDKPERKQKKRP